MLPLLTALFSHWSIALKDGFIFGYFRKWFLLWLSRKWFRPIDAEMTSAHAETTRFPGSDSMCRFAEEMILLENESTLRVRWVNATLISECAHCMKKEIFKNMESVFFTFIVCIQYARVLLTYSTWMQKKHALKKLHFSFQKIFLDNFSAAERRLFFKNISIEIFQP